MRMGAAGKSGETQLSGEVLNGIRPTVTKMLEKFRVFGEFVWVGSNDGMLNEAFGLTVSAKSASLRGGKRRVEGLDSIRAGRAR